LTDDRRRNHHLARHHDRRQARADDYEVIWIGEGERILPTAIVEKFVTRAGGELEPLIAGSTMPIALTVTHAGNVKVKRYTFSMP
jgi:hypothetical protein